MNSPQISVVLVGRDARLMEGRKWALQGRGYRVHAVTHPAALEDVPLSPPVALLVLCHSLPNKERSDAIARASARWKDVRKLLLLRGSSSTPDAVLGQVERILDGPTGLLNQVTELAGQRRSSSYSHTY